MELADIFDCDIADLLTEVSSRSSDQAKHLARLLAGVGLKDREMIVERLTARFARALKVVSSAGCCRRGALSAVGEQYRGCGTVCLGHDQDDRAGRQHVTRVDTQIEQHGEFVLQVVALAQVAPVTVNVAREQQDVVHFCQFKRSGGGRSDGGTARLEADVAVVNVGGLHDDSSIVSPAVRTCLRASDE